MAAETTRLTRVVEGMVESASHVLNGSADNVTPKQHVEEEVLKAGLDANEADALATMLDGWARSGPEYDAKMAGLTAGLQIARSIREAS
jgi:hypothetical protein